MSTLCDALQTMLAGIDYSDIKDANDRNAFDALTGTILGLVGRDKAAQDSDDVTAFVDIVNAK